MNENKKTISEEILVTGKELLDTVKRLVAAGNVRSIILWNEEGKKLLEIPLTAGVALGSVAFLMAPFIAAIAAIAAVAKKVRVEVVPRTPTDQDTKNDEPVNKS